MTRQLPPLNALRAFEASARHLSFAGAAAELGVTPAAISHQVRQLEQRLGVQLFRRLTRKVVLTEAGTALLPGLTEGFDALDGAVGRLRALETGGRLMVSTTPSFATKWLVPRIERFNAAHPDIDLLISPGAAITDFRSEPIDVAIRYGRGNYPGLRVEKLFAEALTPMCAPSLIDRPHPLTLPSDLRYHTLIHDDSAVLHGPVPDWGTWLRLAGAPEVDASRGRRFVATEHAISAAIDGMGVVLARPSPAHVELAAGRLVCPFDREPALDFGYFLVSPDTAGTREKVGRFRDWLFGEIARDEGGAGAGADG